MIHRCVWLFCMISFFLTPVQAAERVVVKRVLDGDTLVLEDGRRIRLIGVDAPEIHNEDKLKEETEIYGKDVGGVRAMGEKAKAFVEGLVAGKKAILEYDIFNAVSNDRDQYGRTLAYVKFDCRKPPQELADLFKARGLKLKWKKEGVNLSAIILQCGYGRVFKKFPFKYQDSFKQFEKEARENHLGLWKPDLSPSETGDTGLKISQETDSI